MPRLVTPLVGRDAELADLVGALDGAATGSASVVVLAGDAGVGKTRLVAEVSGIAAERGFRVLTGHCLDLGETPPPYLAISEALTSTSSDDGAFAAVVQQHPALVRLLPGRDRTNDSRIDAHDLFDAVVTALIDLSLVAPVLLVVEDLHWADQATLGLLGFLFSRLSDERIAVVATYRSDDVHRRHPFRPVIAAWTRLPVVHRMQLDRLGDSDLATLVRAFRPGISVEELPNIVRRADGNAFFAEELGAVAEQLTDPQHLPWQLADLLLVRLDRLDDDARRVAQAAAVAGRRVRHVTLTEVLELSPDRLDAALRSAIDAHVLELTDDGSGYVFRHALLAEAAYDDLLPGERSRLHAIYARMLAARPMVSHAELARHALASHDESTAYAASRAAADEALRLAASQEALTHLETALSLAQRLGPEVGDPADVALAIGEAADLAGRPMRAARIARELLDRLPANAPALSRAKLLFVYSRARLAEEIDEESADMAAEALQLVPAEPPTTFRAGLLAVQAHNHVALNRLVEGEQTAHEAIAVGAASEAWQAVRDAQTTLAIIERRRGANDEASTILRQVADNAREFGDALAEVRARFSLAYILYEAGTLDQAESEYLALLARAESAGLKWQAFGLHARDDVSQIRFARGDWDGAQELRRFTEDLPSELVRVRLLAGSAVVRAARGELAQSDVVELEAASRPLWAREGRVARDTALVAVIAAERTGEIAAAAELLDDVVASVGALWLDMWWLGRIELSARLVGAIATRASGESTTRRTELAALGEKYAADGRTTSVRGLPNGKTLGPEGCAWLAMVEAENARLRWLSDTDPPELDDLIAAWRSAIEAFDYGNVAGETLARSRLAVILNTAGRAAEAAELAEVARSSAAAMGAAPILQSLRGVGAIGSAATRPATATPTGLAALTDREREVLGQLVEGRSNRQIAGRLYISEKTVSVHVSNILAKLEVRSRAEAAALARSSPAGG